MPPLFLGRLIEVTQPVHAWSRRGKSITRSSLKTLAAAAASVAATAEPEKRHSEPGNQRSPTQPTTIFLAN